MSRYLWGIDSEVHVTEELYSSVRSQFGNPKYWGRYLSKVENVSKELTREEIDFIHSKGAKVLPIYHVSQETLGYENGQLVARNAIYHAKRLGIPNFVALFANIEGFTDVSEAWIRGWVETIYPTGYRPGIFHNPVKGDFATAFCEAVAKNKLVSEQTILWSAEPTLEVTKERKKPSFNPVKPTCKANVWLWQYGRAAEVVPINTNNSDSRLLHYLF